MPIEPPDPGFWLRFLQHVLPMLGLGAIITPTVLQRRRSPRKRG